MENLPFIISALGVVLPFLRKCSIFQEKEIGICILKKSGLTTLVNSIENKKSKFTDIFIDLEERVNNSLTETERAQIEVYKTTDLNALRNLILPKLHAIKKECRKSFRGKRIFYFSSDITILHHLKLRKIISFVPSMRLLDAILSHVTPQVRDVLLKNKNDVLHSDTITNSYDTYEHLSQQFCELFKLKMKL